MTRIAISALVLAASLPLAAQQVKPSTSDFKRFIDPVSGVTFSYPSTWTLADDEQFYIPLGITFIKDSSSQNRPRAVIFAKSLPGVESWPKTSFAGVEFGYDSPKAASADVCSALANTEDSPDGPIVDVTIAGITFWRGKSGSGGMGHSIEEDIYTTFSAASGNCLRFDLALHSENVDGDTPMRPLSPRELAIIHRSLRDVLASIRIPTPTR
jgi:hypothetical protein